MRGLLCYGKEKNTDNWSLKIIMDFSICNKNFLSRITFSVNDDPF